MPRPYMSGARLVIMNMTTMPLILADGIAAAQGPQDPYRGVRQRRSSISAQNIAGEKPSAEVQGHSPNERKTSPERRTLRYWKCSRSALRRATRLRRPALDGIYSWDYLHALGRPRRILAGLPRRSRGQGACQMTDGRGRTADDRGRMGSICHLSSVICHPSSASSPALRGSGERAVFVLLLAEPSRRDHKAYRRVSAEAPDSRARALAFAAAAGRRHRRQRPRHLHAELRIEVVGAMRHVEWMKLAAVISRAMPAPY